MLTAELIGLSLCISLMLYLVVSGFRSKNAEKESLTKPTVKTRSKMALTSWLKTLNLNLPAWLVILGILIIATSIFMLLLEAFPGHISVASIAAMAVTVFCFNSISDAAKWKIKKIEKGLAEALDMMKAALSSGQSQHQAILMAAQSGKGQVKVELMEMLDRLNMGCNPKQAVFRLNSKYNCVATRLFAQVIIARYQSGSDLTFMLNSVNQIIRDRQRHQLQIDTHLSGTRYAAMLCGVLPYLLIPILLWQQPDWFDALLQHPSGPTYLGAALFLQFTGYLWLRRIGRVEQ
ncbi:MAG: type II secretion system F family protein [Aliiglaciecola sp.]|uniref:type II secretion system F family protein n=1 Tax=Aliiglaciecola sp. TaxID=1872441 RepID=UPI003297FBC6